MELFRFSRDVYGREVLEALDRFFSAMPARADVAFVVVHAIYRWRFARRPHES